MASNRIKNFRNSIRSDLIQAEEIDHFLKMIKNMTKKVIFKHKSKNKYELSAYNI